MESNVIYDIILLFNIFNINIKIKKKSFFYITFTLLTYIEIYVKLQFSQSFCCLRMFLIKF